MNTLVIIDMMQQLWADPPMMALPRAKQNSVGPVVRPVAVDVTFRPSLGPGRGLWEKVTLTCF